MTSSARRCHLRPLPANAGLSREHGLDAMETEPCPESEPGEDNFVSEEEGPEEYASCPRAHRGGVLVL